MKGQLVVLHSLILLFLVLFEQGCVPATNQNKADCGENEAFDARTRSCYSVVVPRAAPVATLKQTTILEDSSSNEVVLTYTDSNSDLARDCLVSSVSDNLDDATQATCSCVGGVCSVNLVPDADEYGIGQIIYSIGDVDGMGTSQVLRVDITSVDDAPETDLLTTIADLPSVIYEDTSTAISLAYIDRDSLPVADSCEIEETDSGISHLEYTSCSCTALGACVATVRGTDEYSGTAYFTYRVRNNGLWSDWETVDLVITAVDDPPVLSSQSQITLCEDNSCGTPASTATAYSFVITAATDIDTASGSLVYNIVTSPTKGVLASCMAGNNDLTCTYTPTSDYNGSDSFRYSVTDGTSIVSKTVTVTISAVNDIPYFNPKSSATIAVAASVAEDASLILTTLPTALDEDYDIIEYYQEDSTGPFHGTLSGCLGFGGDGLNCTYTPNDEYSGSDYFIYKGIDINGVKTSNEIKVNITVTDVDDPPTISDIAIQKTHETGAHTITDIVVDEGGGSGEDYQQVKMIMYSDNTTMLPLSTTNWSLKVGGVAVGLDNQYGYSEAGCSGVCTGAATPVGAVTPASANLIYYNSSSLTCYKSTGTTSSDWESVPCGLSFSAIDSTASDDAASKEITLTLLPVVAQVGTVNITVVVYDDGGKAVSDTFNFTVNPVSAIHKGWKHLRAVGAKVTHYDQVKDQPYVCSYTKGGCGGVDCIGRVAPSSTMPSASTNTIYYDELGEKCYYMSETSGWLELNTYCMISSGTLDTTNCTGPSCITTEAPYNTPVAKNVFIYDRSHNKCYRSVGTSDASDWKEYYAPSDIYIEWDPFQISGDGTIIGHNVYRRLANEEFDYQTRINKTTIASTAVSYQDNAANSYDPPAPGTVYYYEVRPIVDYDGTALATDTSEPFKTLRVMSPPENMVFIHRWIANRMMCEKMFKSLDAEDEEDRIDSTENFRCVYKGPGTNSGYYDIGHDMLVDRYEAGCPFSKAPACSTSDGTCIGSRSPTSSPAIVAAEKSVYYDRSTGICYYKKAGGWSSDLSELEDSLYRKAELPPITNITQSNATSFLNKNVVDLSSMIGVTADFDKRAVLPSKLEQMVYSQWDADLSSDVITALEEGAALNSSSKCNASSASGYSALYSDADIPASTSYFTLPGTATSQIRSVVTGSDLTKDCQSRFGVQDHVGNVSEWSYDTLECTTIGVCQFKQVTLNFDRNDNGSYDDKYKWDWDTGVCASLDGENCNAPMTSWLIEERLNNAGRMYLPVGLPANVNYPSLYPDANFAADMLSIGSTSGVTIDDLHGDEYHFNTANIYAETNKSGVLATGGNYESGSGAGVFNVEIKPESATSVDRYYVTYDGLMIEITNASYNDNDYEFLSSSSTVGGGDAEKVNITTGNPIEVQFQNNGSDGNYINGLDALLIKLAGDSDGSCVEAGADDDLNCIGTPYLVGDGITFPEDVAASYPVPVEIDDNYSASDSKTGFRGVVRIYYGDTVANPNNYYEE